MTVWGLYCTGRHRCNAHSGPVLYREVMHVCDQSNFVQGDLVIMPQCGQEDPCIILVRSVLYGRTLMSSCGPSYTGKTLS